MRPHLRPDEFLAIAFQIVQHAGGPLERADLPCQCCHFFAEGDAVGIHRRLEVLFGTGESARNRAGRVLPWRARSTC